MNHRAGLAAARAAAAARVRRRANDTTRGWLSHKPLTARECEVLAAIVSGASGKEVASELGISPRTVEIHRQHIMRKLGAKNVADLVRMVMNHKHAS